jgi:hypothetical protein
MSNLACPPLIVFALAATCAAVSAAEPEKNLEPVKRIEIYVTPYYESAETSDGAPQVAVGRKFDALLSSNKREDILAARDLVEAAPQKVTPMTMMVLAIRCYDVGLRDDAVFWFYVAKERAATMGDVLDMKSPALFEANQAIGAFATLAGPVINGYAFCDLAKQKAARTKALAWVEKNTYETLFILQAPAKLGDRRENLKTALEAARERMRKEQEYLAKPETVEMFKKTRAENGLDKKFCWED